MMCRWPLYALVTVLCLGCGNSPNPEGPAEQPDKIIQINESDVDTLDGETLTDADTLARPSNLVMAGSYLVIKDSHGDPAVHVVRRSDGSYVTSLGEPGQGPGQFSAWTFDVTSFDPPRFWVNDLSQRRLTYVDLERYLEGQFELGERIINLDIAPTSPVWLGDSLVVSPAFMAKEGRLAKLNPSGTFLGTMGVSPPPRNEAPMPVLQHAYQSWMKPRPGDRSLLALGTFYADRIEIYHADGTRKALVQGPALFEPIFEVATREGEPVRGSTDETRYGYIDLATTEQHIYALYSGRRRDESGNHGETIRVFDWDGNLEHVYNLKAAILSIAVDPAETTLYATQRAPDLEITKYPLQTGS